MISKTREAILSKLEESIGYKYNNINLLNNALIHTSYCNENSSFKGKSNERLEFLGDAVLELVYTKILFKYFRDKDEGYLTKLRANLVCEVGFSRLSDKINLSKYLLLGKGEEKTGGREKDSLKSDAFEALCGSMYIDSGFEVVYNFIFDLIKDDLSEIKESKEMVNDYKSMLQEYLHKYKNTNFSYKLVKEEGPSHDKLFYIDLYKGNKKIGSGVGKNKKMAEQMAAETALEYLGVLD